MWKLSMDVENEPPVLFEPPVLNVPFLRNVSMKLCEKRKPFIISLKFRTHLIRAAQILQAAQFIQLAHFPHPGSISTFRQLKSVILFLFDFKKRSYLGENEGTEVFRGSFSPSKMWKMSRPY